jgi:hypothetical protein
MIIQVLTGQSYPIQVVEVAATHLVHLPACFWAIQCWAAPKLIVDPELSPDMS